MAKSNDLATKFDKGFSELGAERVRALEDRDAFAYYTVCNALGIEGIEDPELYEVGALEARGRRVMAVAEAAMVDEMVAQEDKREDFRAKPTKFDYMAFGEEASRGDYCPGDVFARTADKRKLLERYGVHKIRVSGGEIIPLDRASPEKVGRVFQDRWEGYQRRR
ncbi:MAG: hypothetical protein NUV97_01185 [archaeon]|nr:hypothetical protein [archaeon]MCR4323424.1 hypothetical protein [Nanoarchaeota archaeon]